ncbi:hypothetical protein TYRP_009718 [Tyrophagus putrescentiae]|nr:hypothetical protein TYRP_009718 [Tyrophagus putrescentiae]
MLTASGRSSSAPLAEQRARAAPKRLRLKICTIRWSSSFSRIFVRSENGRDIKGGGGGGGGGGSGGGGGGGCVGGVAMVFTVLASVSAFDLLGNAVESSSSSSFSLEKEELSPSSLVLELKLSLSLKSLASSLSSLSRSGIHRRGRGLKQSLLRRLLIFFLAVERGFIVVSWLSKRRIITRLVSDLNSGPLSLRRTGALFFILILITIAVISCSDPLQHRLPPVKATAHREAAGRLAQAQLEALRLLGDVQLHRHTGAHRPALNLGEALRGDVQPGHWVRPREGLLPPHLHLRQLPVPEDLRAEEAPADADEVVGPVPPAAFTASIHRRQHELLHRDRVDAQVAGGGGLPAHPRARQLVAARRGEHRLEAHLPPLLVGVQRHQAALLLQLLRLLGEVVVLYSVRLAVAVLRVVLGDGEHQREVGRVSHQPGK